MNDTIFTDFISLNK